MANGVALIGTGKGIFQKISNQPLALTSMISNLLFFLFFRARYALSGHYITFAPNSDDSTYVHHLIGLSDALGITSGISETWLLSARQFSGVHPPGISIAWLPAALVAKLFHFFLPGQYSELLVAFLGALNWFYFCLAMFLFLKYTKAFLRPMTALALFLTIPILYYATHRISMTHPVEALLNILFFHQILKPDENKKTPLLQFVILAFLSFIRYQYILLIPVYVIFVLWERVAHARRLFWLVTAGIVLICASLGYIFFPSNYVTGNRLFWVWEFHTKSAKWLYTWVVPFIDPSWGILFLSGGACLIFLYSLLQAIRSPKRTGWKEMFLLIWGIHAYLLAVFWGKQGDDVQYRFLVPLITVSPFLVYVFPMERLLESRFFKIINGFGCCLTLLLVWMVKTKEYLTVTMHPPNFWMSNGWHNYWLLPKMIYGIIMNPIDLIRPLALSPTAALVITLWPLESLQKYALTPIASSTLVAMIAAHLFLFFRAIWKTRTTDPA